MDVLIRYGFSIEEINHMMNTNLEIANIPDEAHVISSEEGNSFVAVAKDYIRMKNEGSVIEITKDSIRLKASVRA